MQLNIVDVAVKRVQRNNNKKKPQPKASEKKVRDLDADPLEAFLAQEQERKAQLAAKAKPTFAPPTTSSEPSAPTAPKPAITHAAPAAQQHKPTTATKPTTTTAPATKSVSFTSSAAKSATTATSSAHRAPIQSPKPNSLLNRNNTKVVGKPAPKAKPVQDDDDDFEIAKKEFADDDDDDDDTNHNAGGLAGILAEVRRNSRNERHMNSYNNDNDNGDDGDDGADNNNDNKNKDDNKDNDNSNKFRRGARGLPSEEMYKERKLRPAVPLTSEQKTIVIDNQTFSTRRFADLKLDERLLSSIAKMGFESMTKIQQVAIPKILSGSDIMLKSPTGSGKTLCYLVPMLNIMLQSRFTRTDGTKGLVLVPTRELVVQVCKVLTDLTRSTPFIVSGSVMGGEKKQSEKARLRKGVTILVATPGRLLDHLVNTQSLVCTNLSIFVLDEADRVLDMGYGEAVKKVVEQLQIKCDTTKLQTVLISATLRDDVQQLATLSLKDPITITADVPTANGASTTTTITQGVSTDEPQTDAGTGQPVTVAAHVPENLLQMWSDVPCKQRLITLLAFLTVKSRGRTPFKSIVFVSSCDAVEFLMRLLNGARWPKSLRQEMARETSEGEDEGALIRTGLYQLHGNMSQQNRTEVYHTFCRTGAGILLCTSVAARGLDLPAVDWIVQYDPACDVDEYVHRVGRTARLGRRGHALVFLTPSEKQYVDELNKHKLQLVELSLESIHTKFCPNRTQYRLSVLQRHLEDIVTQHEELHMLAVKAFRSQVRAYAAYPRHMKHIFHPKKLHLGHLAKSFCLKEQPNKMMKMSTIEEKKRQLEGEDDANQGRKQRLEPDRKRQRRMVSAANKITSMEFG